MPVVVNEFEVVPTAEPAPADPPRADAPQPPKRPATDEVERALRTRAERNARLEAC